MTKQEQLKKIEEIVHEYAQDQTLLTPPAQETARQKDIREDLQAIVSVLASDDVEPDMSVAQIKAKLRSLWEKAKPADW